METALVTGMLETKFLPVKQAKMDVKESNTESFGAVLETSLKKNDVVDNKEVEKTKDEKVEVETETDKNTEDVENIVSDSDDEEIKENKKDKKNKKEDVIPKTQVLEIVVKDVKLEECITKDVSLENTDVSAIGSIKSGELEITPEEKLNNLLDKLDVKLTNDVEIKDDGENVIKVGPQSVETEKIELNIKDVEEVVKKENIQDNIFVSEKNNNPEIQNPFKIKKSTEEPEVNTDKSLNMEDVEQKLDAIKLNVSKEEVLNNKEVQNKEDVLSQEVEFKKGNTDKKVVEIKEDNKAEISDRLDNVELEQSYEDNFSKSSSENSETDKKDEKLKIKDFRTKNDVDFSKEIFEQKEVKLENKFEIKDVNNIGKFENLVFEQDVLEQVTEKLEVSLFDNKSEMVIKLKPNDLGKVTVKISIENGVMNAKFLADSVKVKEALESNLNNLKESLKEQGLNVQDLNVSVDSGRSQNHQFEQSNIRYFNNRNEHKLDNSVSYEDTYYEFSDININNIKKYWMDSTVSFLA